MRSISISIAAVLLATGGYVLDPDAGLTATAGDAVTATGAETVTAAQVASGPASRQTVASPGAEATDTFGILPGVHRVSIRRGDDFVGWLSSYLLVPEVFGSAGGGRNHQTERFTGADCADVLVGAIRRMGRSTAGPTVSSMASTR